jgi:hypothetical protein
MIYIASFKKIGFGIQKLIGVHTDTQKRERISLLQESRLIMHNERAIGYMYTHSHVGLFVGYFKSPSVIVSKGKIYYE